MVMKLIQRRFLKGSREFEILEGNVHVRIKTLRKEEKLTVSLAILNPEPVVNRPFLEFHSRVKCGPLLSLLLDNPDTKAFSAFVDELKQRAREEYSEFTGLRTGSRAEGLAANSYEEPPEFDEPGNHRNRKNRKPVSAESIDSSIRMLEQYLEVEEIEPLLAALQALKVEPNNESYLGQLVNAFDDLGLQQGAVLTYAPYIGILLSDDPFEY
jgi:hypothetical protein